MLVNYDWFLALLSCGRLRNWHKFLEPMQNQSNFMQIIFNTQLKTTPTSYSNLQISFHISITCWSECFLFLFIKYTCACIIVHFDSLDPKSSGLR